MSYIEKEKLIKADIASIENRVRHAFNQGYDLGFKDGKKAKPQDIDYKAQYERLSKKAEIVISQLRADRDRLMSLVSVTPQESRWIPVSEWLPEESTAVLVWCPERKNIYCACYEEKQWWIFGPCWEKVTGEIVAWRPLPTKPYSEVEE